MVAVLADRPTSSRPALRLVPGGRSATPDVRPTLPTVAPPAALRSKPPARPVRRPSAVVVRRRRLVMALVAAMAVTGLPLALQAALGGGGGGPLTTATASRGAPQPAAAHAWVVQPGETLWGIATELQPHGDVRPLVARLAAQLHGQPLQVGERLTLP